MNKVGVLSLLSLVTPMLFALPQWPNIEIKQMSHKQSPRTFKVEYWQNKSKKAKKTGEKELTTTAPTWTLRQEEGYLKIKISMLKADGKTEKVKTYKFDIKPNYLYYMKVTQRGEDFFLEPQNMDPTSNPRARELQNIGMSVTKNIKQEEINKAFKKK